MNSVQLILVDEKDNELGYMEKLKAHREGKLHRAFSVFLFNNKQELLLQKRASKKYHSGGLWSNTCCSHPEYGQDINDAVSASLLREMGIKCATKKTDSFIYKETLDNGFTEYELDYVFIGNYSQNPSPNPEEVEDWKYMNIDEIITDLKNNEKNYTVWFSRAFSLAIKNIK